MEDRDEHYRNVFAELIREKLGLFRSIAARIVNTAADADDVVQTALLKAWIRRKSFKSDSAALSGWVCRIVVTESYDFLRKRLHEERKRNEMPEREFHDDSDLVKLDRAIAELPELYRETVHIAILSGLPGEEAARQLGCSPNTLYQRIYKAKSLLREILRRVDDE